MKKISVKEYAELRGVTETSVKNALIKKKKLFAVQSYEKFDGWMWMLLTDIKKAKTKKGFVVESLEVTK